jgi:hypothetical protein
MLVNKELPDLREIRDLRDLRVTKDFKVIKDQLVRILFFLQIRSDMVMV